MLFIEYSKSALIFNKNRMKELASDESALIPAILIMFLTPILFVIPTLIQWANQNDSVQK